jgi:hypothetical protein
MAVKPYTVLADCTVRGQYIRHGTVVGLDPAGELWAEYGGAGNLTPLAGDETGDDADKSALSN